MQKKLKIKKGDQVMVITGESKGQKGRVLEVNRDKTGYLLKVSIWYQNIQSPIQRHLRVES